MGKVAYIGLGSNIGDRAANLKRALNLLKARQGLKVKKASSLYEAEPVGLKGQPWFLNAVVEVETSLSPEGLFKVCQEIEAEMGRRRESRGGPRVIDLDILLYGDSIIDEEDLKIPHPRMHTRRFVLVPLAEIAPEAIHPAFKKTASSLLGELKDEHQVRRYG